jgi:hypothetical protein
MGSTMSKEERADKQREELKAENSFLEQRLTEERAERERLMGLMEEAVTTKQPKRRRRFGVIRTLAIIGVAYIFGARAGRERYEEIMAWAKRNLADRVSSLPVDLAARDPRSLDEAQQRA